MDFNYSEGAEAFRREFRAWLDANLPQGSRGNSLQGEFMRAESADWKFHLEWHKKMHSSAWVGISWPKEYGGRGATLEQQIVYNEELARANAPSLVNALGIGLVGPTLMHWGTEEQKKRYIPRSSLPTKSGARATPNPMPARMSHLCKPAPSRRATISSSTARRYGPPAPSMRIGASCSPGLTRQRPNTRVSATFSSICTARRRNG